MELFVLFLFFASCWSDRCVAIFFCCSATEWKNASSTERNPSRSMPREAPRRRARADGDRDSSSTRPPSRRQQRPAIGDEDDANRTNENQQRQQQQQQQQQQ